MTGYKLQGPIGTSSNNPVIDKGTSCLTETCIPGPVSRSSTAATAKEGPQVLLAYNAWGHQYLSTQAIEAALKALQSSSPWIRYFLSDTPTSAVYRDMTDVWTLAHWRATTQKHHFMRAKGQTHEAAWIKAVGWIRENAYRASYNLRRMERVTWPLSSMVRQRTPRRRISRSARLLFGRTRCSQEIGKYLCHHSDFCLR